MMIATLDVQPRSDKCRFVEVLSTSSRARKLGYRLGGSRPGPNVLVAGLSRVAEQVFEGLLALPTLPWLRGELVLIALEALDEEGPGGRVEALSETGFDEILFLPYAVKAPFSEEAAREGYRTVLRLCTQLGMIDGRGVH
jgi:hypothetical protein